jgi:hypothetical protein
VKTICQVVLAALMTLFLGFPGLAIAQGSNAAETTLKGKAAWDSPQGKALAEFLQAGRTGDKETLNHKRLTARTSTSFCRTSKTLRWIQRLRRSTV